MNLSYTIALLASATIAGMIAFIAWQRRSAPGANALFALALALLVWALTYAIHWTNAYRPNLFFWLDLTYFGVVAAPTAFFAFALLFTGSVSHLSHRHILLLTIMPFLTVLLLWTDGWHHLFFGGQRGEGAILTGGPWFWINALYLYGLVLVGIVFLVRYLVRTPSLYRGQVVAILLGACFPVLGSIVGVAGISPFPDFDLTPFAFTLTGLAFAYGLFIQRMLDIIPVARDVLIENISDSVLVLDTQDRIIDLNPAASRLINQPEKSLLGRNLADVLPARRALVEQFRHISEGEYEVTLDGNPPRYLDVRISPLRDRRGTLTGRAIVLRDITDRKHAEQEIHQHLTELSTINAVSQAVASQNELEAILRVTGEHVRQLLNAHGVFISLYDTQTHTIHTPYWRLYDEFITAPSIPLGQGLTSHVIHTRQPLLINQDYEQQSAALGVVRVESQARERPKAWLGVPMIVSDQVIGVIGAQNYERENAFTQNDVRVWTTIAANVGVAIRNAQLYDETRHYADQMAVLNRIGLAITEDFTMDRLLPTLHRQCQQIAPIDAFYVALYDERTFQRRVVYFDDRGEQRTTPPTDIRVAPGLTGYIIQTRRTLYLPDTLDPDHPPPVPLIRTGGQPSHSFVGVPLIWRDHVVGVISMQSYEPNAYSPKQIHLLELVAVQAAIAVANAQLYDQVQRLAVTDELTGLPNRRVLYERGADEVNRAKRFYHPLAVAMLDIDHFKTVNDTYLHAAGDLVLRAIADTFRQDLRNTDLAARYGGEEFVLVFPETESSVAYQVVERLRHHIAHTDVAIGQNKTIRVTLSAGIAILEPAMTSFDELIQRADQALYVAKQTGRDRAIVWSRDLP